MPVDGEVASARATAVRCQRASRLHSLPPLRGTREGMSLAFLKRRITEGVRRSWLSDTTTRMKKGAAGKGAFVGPDKRARPGIRTLLRGTRKGVTSRFFQLLSGHAMIAPFLKDRWGWTETDSCWWCNGGRQSRDHLFKECGRWAKEIKDLWKEVGRASGRRQERGGPFKSRKGFCFHVRMARARPSNTTVRELLSDDRYTEAVLEFLGKTKVGIVKEGVICK